MLSTVFSSYIRERIRTVPDWPRPGIQFRDITPLLRDKKTFRVLVDLFVHRHLEADLDYVAGVDARGFILAAAIAYELNIGFIPIRKKGKLPFETLTEDYALEYGSASIEIHTDACRPGDRILLIDDLVATGGTLVAAAKLLKRLGAEVVEAAVIVGLPELGGSAILRRENIPLYSVCEFPGH
jgi:adenine phosphoribosyltransferase